MMYRKMELTDIPAGLSLCRSAGWNQLHRDWEIFLLLNSEGNRVCTNDQGKVVGTVTTIKYGNNFAWIGMVLVDPSHQRQGIGLKLMEEAMIILKNEDSVKLDATPAGRQVYLKLGFKDEYPLSRMLAQSVNVDQLVPPTAVQLTVDDLASVALLDDHIFGANRMAILKWMFDNASELAFKITDNNNLTGYCFGRYGYRFTHIGPVVAANLTAAKSLVSAALKRCQNKPVILDILHHDKAWSQWIKALGFSELRPFIRMYKGANRWPGCPKNQFAILGPEFG